MSYGKIYPSMFTGSLCGSGALVFAVMGYAIANARPDFNSTVSLNPIALSGIFGEKADAIADAIRSLCAPDEYSRSTEEGGRRLVRIGESMDYRVVNLEKYRFLDREEQREYWRKNKQRQREAKNVPACPGQMRTVLHADADADADADACTNKSTKTRVCVAFTKPTFPELELQAQKIGLPPTEIDKFFNYYESNGWRVGKVPMKSWRAAMAGWKTRYQERQANLPQAQSNHYHKPPVVDWGTAELRKLGVKI